jgi:hypothetical protein
MVGLLLNPRENTKNSNNSKYKPHVADFFNTLTLFEQLFKCCVDAEKQKKNLEGGKIEIKKLSFRMREKSYFRSKIVREMREKERERERERMEVV